MKKYIAIAIALVVVGWGFSNYFPEFSPKSAGNDTPSSPLLTTFYAPSFKLPGLEQIGVKGMALDVWEKYLDAAKNHDLIKIKELSYQLSSQCTDPDEEAECFQLMNSIYFFGSTLKSDDFKYVEADNKQVIMYTDGPDRSILYFTKDTSGNMKLLGVRVCSEDQENPQLTCADLNVYTRDDDGDGWWNSTESLFR